jgi:hypothetical protein
MSFSEVVRTDVRSRLHRSFSSTVDHTKFPKAFARPPFRALKIPVLMRIPGDPLVIGMAVRRIRGGGSDPPMGGMFCGARVNVTSRRSSFVPQRRHRSTRVGPAPGHEDETRNGMHIRKSGEEARPVLRTLT